VPFSKASSALALFMFGVGADHAHYALAVNDLALVANLLYRRSHFHENQPSALSRQLSAKLFG
jgi:hypothetical protein